MMTELIRTQLSCLYSCIGQLRLFFMYRSEDEHLLSTCFQELTGFLPSSLTPLRPHASERRRYRLQGRDCSYIGVVNGSAKENDTFISFARHFASVGLAVPCIYHYRPESRAYIEQDLGDTTLLDFLNAERQRTGESFPTRARTLYLSALEQLPRFQIDSLREPSFAQQISRGDLSTNVLKPDLQLFLDELVARVLPTFNGEELATDFNALCQFLAAAQNDFFMYRDFQARNIMIVNSAPYFIDFQGGRRGPLQYDVVSLLYQTSARIPGRVRQELRLHYIRTAHDVSPIDVEAFARYFSAFIAYRMLQVLGVYGKQGLGAGKEYFSSSIPGAIKTLVNELEEKDFPLRLPKLLACAHRLLNAFL
jgi:aminoglycoside/choline kinase family phosphotransferase